MSRFQKGQSIVEFAVVLPLFFLLLWGFVYFGMFFSDYLMLNNMARSSAREASLQESVSDIAAKYTKECKKNQITKLYQLKEFYIGEDPDDHSNVYVRITESMNTGDSNANILNRTFQGFLGDSALQSFQIEYRMYWEAKKS